MENIYEKIMITNKKPLFENKIINEDHKIFYKYTSYKYYKYIYELLDTLSKKSPYKNNSSIFHISLYYILIILYNCENIPYLNNLDLIVLICFSLGIKASIIQIDFPTINKLKKIYEEKYINYENKEICEGEIICLKLLDYNINILTAYECIIYLTQNDTKLKELSLANLESLMFNDLRQFIYKSSFDVAMDSIKTIKERIIVKEPKIIKKKIILNKYNCGPIIKKYSSSDKLVNLINEYQDLNQMSNDEIKITTKKITNININKPKFSNKIISKETSILKNNLKIANIPEKIYYKKNCNYMHPSSSDSLMTEANLIKMKNDKRYLFFAKINKVPGKDYISKNNRNNGTYLRINKKSIDICRKKIYLNNNKRYIRNNYDQFDESINNTKYLKCKYNNNSNISNENDSYFINLYNKRNGHSDINNFDNNNSTEDYNNKSSFYNSFIKGINLGIETKNINIGALKKNNPKNQRYYASIKRNEKHFKLNSITNNFNKINISQEENFFPNKSMANYFIKW